MYVAISQAFTVLHLLFPNYIPHSDTCVLNKYSGENILLGIVFKRLVLVSWEFSCMIEMHLGSNNHLHMLQALTF